jgi:hypothetical protein
MSKPYDNDENDTYDDSDLIDMDDAVAELMDDGFSEDEARAMISMSQDEEWLADDDIPDEDDLPGWADAEDEDND